MASQYLARLGIVLGIDSGELVQGIEDAKKQFHNFKNQVEKDTKAAAREFEVLKNATEDYGKTLTKVEQIQREIDRGRFMFASQNVKDKLLEQAKAYDAQAASMKKVSGVMTEQQKLQVSYQLTDFFTQVASGQNVMIAFLQQGGQLKDSMGGVGNALKAVATILTPMRLLVGGVAGAFGTLAYAAYQGSKEVDAFKDSMSLTGRFAGVTYDEFVKFGNLLSSQTSSSIGNARDAMSALVASGKFTKDSIDSAGRAILNFARLTGTDAKEAAKELIPLLDGTASSAKSLNDRYHFLTAAQYKQIEALERQGKLQEAAKITADAMSESFEKTRRDLGTLEKSWKAVHDWASKTWDAMLGFGREAGADRAKDLENKINELSQEIEDRRSKGLKTGSQEAAVKAFRAELQQIVDRMAAEIDATNAAAKKAADEKKKIDMWSKAGGAEGAQSAKKAADKAELESDYKSREAVASEQERIEIELQKKIQQARLEESEKNQKTLGQYQSEWARERIAKVADAEAEAERKRKELRWKKDVEAFDKESEIVERLARERAEIFKSIGEKKLEQSFAREELQAKFSLIGATQKEIDLAKAKLETERDIQKLKLDQKFMNMSEEDQQKAIAGLEAAGKMKQANIELAESFRYVQGMYDAVWSNMSSAIETFVRTGKLSIKDFTRSVIQDMLIMNMKLQAMQLVRGLLGSFMAGFNTGSVGNATTMAPGGGYFADGGDPPVGKVSVVGEKGPELFVPRTAGTIVPNHALAGMGSTTNVTNNYINAIDAKSFEQRLLESNQTIWSANQYASKNLATNFGRT